MAHICSTQYTEVEKCLLSHITIDATTVVEEDLQLTSFRVSSGIILGPSPEQE